MIPQGTKNHRSACTHSTDLTNCGDKESRVFVQTSGPPSPTQQDGRLEGENGKTDHKNLGDEIQDNKGTTGKL